MDNTQSVDTLVRAAQAAIARGVMIEAERAYAAVLDADPNHIEALAFVAARALAASRVGDALQFYECLATLRPDDASVLTGLGQARLQSGQLDAARAALGAVLERTPDAFVARFHLAQTYERGGDTHAALVHYFRAISDAQTQGRWLNDATTHVSIRGPVRRAMAFVDKGRLALYDRVLEPLRHRFGASELRRVEHCLRIYLHMEPPPYQDARQRPSFLYFPSLPATPYLPKSSMPWLQALESNVPAIIEEMLRVLDEQRGFEPFLRFHKLEEARNYLTGNDGKGGWNAYFFYRHGERYAANCEQCPRTAATLEQAPLLRIHDHAPEICFSLLTPGSHILPHRGVTNTRIVVHLPLLVPEDAALNVGGEPHVWRVGEAVAFDDTYEHEAWNRSASNRVIVLMDAWNPHLTEAEREAVTDLVIAIGEFGKEAGQVLSLA